MQGLPGRNLRRLQEVRQGASICLEPQAAPKGSKYPNSLVLTGLSGKMLSHYLITNALSKIAPSSRCSGRVWQAVSAGLQLCALTQSTRQSWELNTSGGGGRVHTEVFQTCYCANSFSRPSPCRSSPLAKPLLASAPTETL